jgi:hypothetical protein
MPINFMNYNGISILAAILFRCLNLAVVFKMVLFNFIAFIIKYMLQAIILPIIICLRLSFGLAIATAQFLRSLQKLPGHVHVMTLRTGKFVYIQFIESWKTAVLLVKTFEKSLALNFNSNQSVMAISF